MDKGDTSSTAPIVVGIGEALFDSLPDGLVLGGAPVNFAVHVHRLLESVGGRGIIVSRVGDDELGRRIASELVNRRMPTDSLQIDPQHRTGTVEVELSTEEQPTYMIAEDVAWDHLQCDDSLLRLARRCHAICFGTLSQRHKTSRASIQRFLSEAINATKVLDVNLRQQYYSRQVLQQSLQLANVVKLNVEELETVYRMFSDELSQKTAAEDQIKGLIAAFDLELVALTRGHEGTVLFTKHEVVTGQPISMQHTPGADSVGAGDACCAGIVYGCLMQWPLQRIVDLANRLGAFVASQPGATPALPDTLLEANDI